MIDGILTWHKALNHGAVLQAYATQNFLKECGYKVEILDYRRIVKDMRNPVVLAIKRVNKVLNGGLKFREQIGKMDAEKAKLFECFRDNNLCQTCYCDQTPIDHLIIGSDMVFNLKQGYNPYMFGYGIKANSIYSYAASAGGTKYDLVKKMNLENDLKLGLEKFKMIGVRDKETTKFIEAIIPNAHIIENIDPVLLYGFDTEKKEWNIGKWSSHKKYMLVYAYHGFMDSKNEVQELVGYARKNNLSIVSCGYFHPWCDEIVNADPKEFLEMFINAYCVATDTFHGTVFSIINRKQFVTIIRDNGFKLRYLLESCFLSSRIANNTENIQKVLTEKIDYTLCDVWLNEQRKTSGDYLKKIMKSK